jgi:hypothetical protein
VEEEEICAQEEDPRDQVEEICAQEEDPRDQVEEICAQEEETEADAPLREDDLKILEHLAVIEVHRQMGFEVSDSESEDTSSGSRDTSSEDEGGDTPSDLAFTTGFESHVLECVASARRAREEMQGLRPRTLPPYFWGHANFCTKASPCRDPEICLFCRTQRNALFSDLDARENAQRVWELQREKRFVEESDLVDHAARMCDRCWTRTAEIWCKKCFDLGPFYRKGYCSHRCLRDDRDAHARTCGKISIQMEMRARIDLALRRPVLARKVSSVLWEGFCRFGASFYVVLDIITFEAFFLTYDKPVNPELDLFVRNPRIRTKIDPRTRTLNCLCIFNYRNASRVHGCFTVIEMKW